jgi:hypothetical protein
MVSARCLRIGVFQRKKMPSSRHNHIPTVLSIVQQLQPNSLLDVGIGFGKWGHLFREYLDIVPAEREADRYRKEKWKVIIDGIEGYPAYITPSHNYYYNNIYLGEMRAELKQLGSYDVIFIGDVIEHIEKDEGAAFLQTCFLHARKAVVVTTPARWVEQQAVCNNPLEIHRSFWTRVDFESLGRCCATVIIENDILVAVFVQAGTPMPSLRSFVPRSRKSPIRRATGYVQPLAAAARRRVRGCISAIFFITKGSLH